MNSFVKEPYLPKGKVKKIIAGGGIRKFENELNKLGISVVYTSENKNLQKPVMNHADMVCNYIGDKNFILDNTQSELSRNLLTYNAKILSDSVNLAHEYPNDVKLNCVMVSDELICNKKAVSDEILSYAHNNNLKIIDVSQGYTKCSIVVVNENSVITDDIDIFNKLTDNAFEVLLVSKGDVLLNGYNYGFIGGCCGLISKNTMMFIGDLKYHKDYLSILNFLDIRGIDIINLSKEELIDIGSFIPIIEEKD